MSSLRAFPECRLTWRPSRRAVAVLLALGPLGALSLYLSDVPGAFKPCLAACACLWAIACAHREHRRPPRVLIFRSDSTATLDAMPLTHHHVHWRGALAFFRARDTQGRTHRLAFWPDALGPRGRRALRLASSSLAVQPREMRG